MILDSNNRNNIEEYRIVCIIVEIDQHIHNMHVLLIKYQINRNLHLVRN